LTSPLHTFVGGTIGTWRVERIQAITGSNLPLVPRLSIFEGNQAATLEGSTWLLRGVTSYERYVNKMERFALVAQQAELGRLEATQAALIPIKKSTAWWELTQDEKSGPMWSKRSISVSLAKFREV
jgi:hypothetical protein